MTGCPAHGELIGGYVLGALEPAEMDEMRRHVAGCPRCGPEMRELAGLPGLLDQIEPDAAPPPVLSPEIEEAVLDRVARERRRDRPAPRPRRPFLSPRRIAAAAAALAAAIALVLVLALPGGEDDRRAYARAPLAPVADGRAATGMAYASEVPEGTRVSLRARGLPAGRGALYELWCVRADGRWVSGGTFRPGRDGRAQAVLTAAVRPGDYHVMVVTTRSAGAHRRTILRGELEY